MTPWGQRADEDPSWITKMIETQRKDKGVSISLSLQGEPEEKFEFTSGLENNAQTEIALNPGSVCLRFSQNSEPNNSIQSSNDSSSLGGSHSGSSRTAGKRRRTKAKRTITSEVLRQHFAGSLKDAAKSLSDKVCPTTLKRICRQHGINRWPSRKIKKVGRSLDKLQRVINSVQGAEGTIQLDSFYASFPELCPNLSDSGPAISSKEQPMPNNPSSQHHNPNMNHDSQFLHPQGENGILDLRATAASHSPSSYSQNSTSAIFCSTGSKHDSVANPLTINLLTEDIGEVLKQVQSDAKLHVSSRGESKPKKKLTARSQSHNLFGASIPVDDTPLPTNLPRVEAENLFNSKDSSLFRVKATYGKQKIQFTLHPCWGFLDLQREIAGRLGIDDFSTIDLKYLDDDHEWVLLTCDADLEECIDVYRMSSQGHTIRMSLHQELKPGLDHSLGSQVQSQIHHRFL